MVKVFCFFLFLGLNCILNAQVIYGLNQYTEYHVGNLPIVISVPHGGSVTPDSIPDRTCNSPTLVTDANTIALAKQIDSSLFQLSGCHPHLIFCNLKRTKIDCNREIVEGACGNMEAENAWTEFQHFIDTAQSIAQSQFPGKVFYIDVHGHGHTLQQLELGYLYTSTELGFTDSVLNSIPYIGYGSIQELVASNVNSYSNAELLRGNFALGTLLSQAGYPSVPSLQTPFPGANPYFDGGYNTSMHTCFTSGNTVNGLQMECNYSNVRDNYLNRKKFGDSLASVFRQFYSIHENLDISNCATVEIDVPLATQRVFLYPSVVSENPAFNIQGVYLKGSKFFVSNLLGQEMESGSVENENKIHLQNPLNRGVYYLFVKGKARDYSFTFVVQ